MKVSFAKAINELSEYSKAVLCKYYESNGLDSRSLMENVKRSATKTEKQLPVNCVRPIIALQKAMIGYTDGYYGLYSLLIAGNNAEEGHRLQMSLLAQHLTLIPLAAAVEPPHTFPQITEMLEVQRELDLDFEGRSQYPKLDSKHRNVAERMVIRATALLHGLRATIAGILLAQGSPEPALEHKLYSASKKTPTSPGSPWDGESDFNFITQTNRRVRFDPVIATGTTTVAAGEGVGAGTQGNNTVIRNTMIREIVDEFGPMFPQTEVTLPARFELTPQMLAVPDADLEEPAAPLAGYTRRDSDLRQIWRNTPHPNRPQLLIHTFPEWALDAAPEMAVPTGEAARRGEGLAIANLIIEEAREIVENHGVTYDAGAITIVVDRVIREAAENGYDLFTHDNRLAQACTAIIADLVLELGGAGFAHIPNARYPHWETMPPITHDINHEQGTAEFNSSLRIAVLTAVRRWNEYLVRRYNAEQIVATHVNAYIEAIQNVAPQNNELDRDQGFEQGHAVTQQFAGDRIDHWESANLIHAAMARSGERVEEILELYARRLLHMEFGTDQPTPTPTDNQEPNDQNTAAANPDFDF